MTAPRVPVRYLPLGSPSDGPKVLFLVWHGPVVVCGGGPWWGRVGTGRVGIPGTTRVGIPGTTQLAYIGIARAQPLALARGSASARSLQALLGPPHNLAPRTQHMALQPQYGRDSIKYILKLVDIPECHHKVSMRPGMLPVSKRAPKVTTLNS